MSVLYKTTIDPVLRRVERRGKQGRRRGGRRAKGKKKNRQDETTSHFLHRRRMEDLLRHRREQAYRTFINLLPEIVSFLLSFFLRFFYTVILENPFHEPSASLYLFETIRLANNRCTRKTPVKYIRKRLNLSSKHRKRRFKVVKVLFESGALHRETPRVKRVK